MSKFICRYCEGKASSFSTICLDCLLSSLPLETHHEYVKLDGKGW